MRHAEWRKAAKHLVKFLHEISGAIAPLSLYREKVVKL